MKILEVGGSGAIFTDKAGPVSTVVSCLSQYLARLGHEVTVVDVENRFVKRQVPPNVRVLEVKAIPRPNLPLCTLRAIKLPLNELMSLKNELKFVRGFMSSHLKAEPFDIIHVHEVYPAYILEHFNKNKPPFIVHTSHTPTWADKDNRMLSIHSRVIKNLTALKEKRLIKKVDLAIVLGRYFEKQFKEIMPCANIAYIPNGIDTTLFHPLDKIEARRKLGVEEKEFIVLFVGRISYIKGVDVLLEATEILKNKILNLKVYIVGSFAGKFGKGVTSDYAKKMINIADKKVCRFLGFVSNKKKLNLLCAASDIFVAPSRFDTQPRVFLEAMACAKAIIGSNVGGIPDMIRDNFNGLLASPNESADLANKILGLYRNPGWALKLGERSRMIAKEEFNWDEIAQRHEEEFLKLICR